MVDKPHCLKLFTQLTAFALSLALLKAGNNIAARIAMIATTMRSSIRVKIRNFTLRSKNLEQGTRKEEVEKQLNN